MSEEEDQNGGKKPIASKFTTTGEKKFSAILNNAFDKNITVEKAKLDLNQQDSKLVPPSLTTSVTLPTVSTLQSLTNNSAPATINTIPSQSTPLITKSSKPKTEDRRNVKRKKLPAMSGAATPSEVFHRNLVDAVSNVEDSDENEQYVYPYSGNNTDTTVTNYENTHRAPSLYRPQSTRSFHHQQQEKNTSFLSDVFRPILSKSQSTTQPQQDYRPKLRNYPKTTTAEWFGDGKHSPPLLYTSAGSSARRQKSYKSFNYDTGYTTDDEEAQHLLSHKRLQQHRYRKQPSCCSKYIMHVIITLFLLVLFSLFCIIYLAKPLKHIKVEMGRVLSSDKELIFDLRIHTINSNLWTIHVADADISVFAFSQVVPMSLDPVVKGVDPAEYLGSFYHFDEPLSFPTSFYTNNPVTAISQIRIKSPGADKSGNERWSRIIRYPYGLVVRGVLKYKPLSFLSPYPQSIAICDVVSVDPNTGKVTEDPDQGFCLSYKQNQTVS